MPNYLQFPQCILFSLTPVPLLVLLPVPGTPSWVWLHCCEALWVPRKDRNVSRDRQLSSFCSRPKRLRKCKNRDWGRSSTGNEPLKYQKFQEVSIGSRADGSRLKNSTESGYEVHHVKEEAWPLRKWGGKKISQIIPWLEGQRQVVR